MYLDLIPDNAIGLMSYDNNDPLQYLNDTRGQHLYEVSRKAFGELVMDVITGIQLGSPCYLGAIVSEDRQTIYWKNETEPIP